MSYKIDIMSKTITKDKEGHYKILKSNHQEILKNHQMIEHLEVFMHLTSENLSILKMTIDLKEAIDNIIIKEKFNTSFSTMHRSFRQKINEETLDSNYALNKMNLMIVERTFHLIAEEHTFFSRTHGTFSKIYNM